MHSKKICMLSLAALTALTLASCDTGSSNEGGARANSILDLHFDEGEGQSAKDASGHLQDATIRSVYETSPTLKTNRGPEWRKGVEGSALLMDGYSTYLRYSSSDIVLSGQQLSITCYVAPRNYDWVAEADTDNFESMTGLVSQFYQDSGYSAGVFLGYSREGYIDFRIGTGDSVYSVDSGDTLMNKKAWNYVSAVYNGAEGYMSLYLNGELVGTATDMAAGTNIAGIAEDLYIGKNPFNQRSDYGCPQGCVSGLLDEVTIYNTALSEETIKANFENETKDADMGTLPYSVIGLGEVLEDDIFRPGYHGAPNEHWMNEPHAPCYYNGMYHIFFQHQVNGPYFNGSSGISWGHLVSTDMVNWHQIDDAITPTLGSVCPDGVWSGGVTYATVDGHENVPCLLFTAGNNARPNGLISGQNIGLAIPKDPTDPYLTEWEVQDDLAVIQTSAMGVANEFRDASVMIEDGYYWLLVGGSYGTSHGTAWLFKAPVGDWHNLMNFQFVGSLYDIKNQDPDLGRTWELPALQRLTDKDGNPTDKYIFLISPAPADTADNNVIYWIGDFDKENGKFIPDFETPKRMDFGQNIFTGPNLFVDPVSRLVTISSIAQDQRGAATDISYYSTGWANNMGLYRHLYLNDDGNLAIVPVDTSANETEEISETDLSVADADAALADVRSDSYKLTVAFSGVDDGETVGLKVRESADGEEYAEFTASGDGTITGNSMNFGRQPGDAKDDVRGALDAAPANGEVSITVYVDRSMLEAFFNDNKTITMRAYPSEGVAADEVSIFAEGEVTVKSLVLSEMTPTASMPWETQK